VNSERAVVLRQAAIAFGTAYAAIAAIAVVFAAFPQCRDPHVPPFSWWGVALSVLPWAIGFTILSVLPDRPRFVTILLSIVAAVLMFGLFLGGGIWFAGWIPALIGFRIGVHLHVKHPTRYAFWVALIAIALTTALALGLMRIAKC
jgi:hypothetical protein